MSIRFAATVFAACVVVGCSGSSDNIGPTNPQSGNGNPGAPPAGGSFVPLFRPTSGVLPFPIDLYFSGSTDGTLNLPASVSALTPHFAALNALDGFSTTADITLRFSGAIDPATLAASVRVIRATIDNATKATIPPVLGILQPGVDYSIGVSPDIDSGGSTVLIRPLRPLAPSTGGTNNGYLILVTDGVTSLDGEAATPDAEYLTVRTAAIADLTGGVNPPSCASIANATLNGVCRLTFAHLAIGSQLPGGLAVAPSNVVASWSFSTVATHDTLAFLAATTAPRPYTVFPMGLTTAFMGLPGFVDLYGGTLDIDYRLGVPTPSTAAVVLTQSWQAAGPSPVPGIDPDSRHLTRFNPVPDGGASLDIPLILSVPNIMPKPPAGWPVVVFMHGFPRDRTDALLVSDTMASRGFATIAIDMPLHGVTPASAAYAQPFAQTPIERTFNLDLQLNAQFGVPGQDGQVDATGANFLNLTNVLVQRDNSRQAIADIIALIRTLPTIDIDPGANPGPDFDGDRIHVIGYSLGGTHAGTAIGLLGAEVKASALPSAGAMLTETIKQSATYGPLINNLLAASGVPADTTLYRNFFRNVQAVFDAADTVNYASTLAGAAAGGREIYISTFEGGAGGFPSDPVVPVSSTRRLIDTAGGSGLTRVNSVGVTNVAGTNGGWVPFSQGLHNSLLDPGPSAATTLELQSQIANFFVTGGDFITITDGTVIAP
ncbi:MAG: hypothetical protein WD793_00925 [Steroidobacteraceae bacterium]